MVPNPISTDWNPSSDAAPQTSARVGPSLQPVSIHSGSALTQEATVEKGGCRSVASNVIALDILGSDKAQVHSPMSS